MLNNAKPEPQERRVLQVIPGDGLKEPKAQPLVLLSRGKELPHERDSCE